MCSGHCTYQHSTQGWHNVQWQLKGTCFKLFSITSISKKFWYYQLNGQIHVTDKIPIPAQFFVQKVLDISPSCRYDFRHWLSPDSKCSKIINHPNKQYMVVGFMWIRRSPRPIPALTTTPYPSVSPRAMSRLSVNRTLPFYRTRSSPSSAVTTKTSASRTLVSTIIPLFIGVA